MKYIVAPECKVELCDITTIEDSLQVQRIPTYRSITSSESITTHSNLNIMDITTIEDPPQVQNIPIYSI